MTRRPTASTLFARTRPGLDFRQLLDGFNEQWVEATTFLSTSVMVELLRLAGEWTGSFYGSVDLERPGEPVGFFGGSGPSPYWQAIAREYVERWVHQHQIRRALGRPDLGPEFLEPAAAVVMRSLAAHLPALDAAPGTVLVLTVKDIASWSCTLGDGGWALEDGRPPDAAAELAPPHAAPDRGAVARAITTRRASGFRGVGRRHAGAGKTLRVIEHDGGPRLSVGPAAETYSLGDGCS